MQYCTVHSTKGRERWKGQGGYGVVVIMAGGKKKEEEAILFMALHTVLLH